MTTPKIKILQYMHGGLEYFGWSEKINRSYCERHGYEYVVSRDEPRTDRHITWHKVPAVFGELHHCDYLLFMDADAIFYSHELTVENELIPLMNGKAILMVQDVGCESLRWMPGKPNSGVILMKNNGIVRRFFKYWDGASEIDESTCWKWPPEQLALWNVVMPKFPDMVQVHHEYYMIQGQYGQYIRHYMVMPNHERLEKMKMFCESRKIS